MGKLNPIKRMEKVNIKPGKYLRLYELETISTLDKQQTYYDACFNILELKPNNKYYFKPHANIIIKCFKIFENAFYPVGFYLGSASTLCHTSVLCKLR